MTPWFRPVVSLPRCRAATAGCAGIGPQSLDDTRLQYNEVVKRTTEESSCSSTSCGCAYTDTQQPRRVGHRRPVRAQPERRTAALLHRRRRRRQRATASPPCCPRPRSYGRRPPDLQPHPSDDQEFTRKLFPPAAPRRVIYLAKTTWPISRSSRLYLENLNAGCPTPSPPAAPHRVSPAGLRLPARRPALQTLQDQGAIVFGVAEQEERWAAPCPPARYRPPTSSKPARTASNTARRRTQLAPGPAARLPVLRLDPDELASPEMRASKKSSTCARGRHRAQITREALIPFRSNPAEGRRHQPRPRDPLLLQALYYVSHGVDVPAEHRACGLVTITRDADGGEFDWQESAISSACAPPPGGPAHAHVAVRYKGVSGSTWTKPTRTPNPPSRCWSNCRRLELSGKTGPGPQLTLPVRAPEAPRPAASHSPNRLHSAFLRNSS